MFLYKSLNDYVGILGIFMSYFFASPKKSSSSPSSPSSPSKVGQLDAQQSCPVKTGINLIGNFSDILGRFKPKSDGNHDDIDRAKDLLEQCYLNLNRSLCQGQEPFCGQKIQQ